MKISVFHYIAHNKPEESLSLLKSEGYDVSGLKGHFHLAEALKHAEKEKGEDFSKKLAEIHPDHKNFETHFAEIHSKELDKVKKETEKYLKAEGEVNSIPAQPTVNFVSPITNNKDLVLGVALTFGFVAFVFTAINVAKK